MSFTTKLSSNWPTSCVPVSIILNTDTYIVRSKDLFGYLYAYDPPPRYLIELTESTGSST
ncbi:unnamed protein product [Fusarium graminearum]|uniref:Chromosome 3, complete genome n=1 Tax=Gibberella zeae (strain ATCC MYA-4620 / CBS 123657 / FGSC 9075 / NRRL 31084 / PH-1) TaxID=229533 RepID=A0A098E2D2_GIBZE|nr:unnamed protein product [Fusarium graminearum]CZS84116.1 unnamed protein product [Fusarium graminearum]